MQEVPSFRSRTARFSAPCPASFHNSVLYRFHRKLSIGRITFFPLPLHLFLITFTTEEDLGGTRLLRRGRSLQASPGETFPNTGPHQCIRYCKYDMPGACAGEFLLGANGVLRLADGRGRPSGCKGSFLMSIRQFAMCSAQETANSRSCVVVRGQKKARATADVIHINSSIISTPSKNRATHGGCPVS